MGKIEDIMQAVRGLSPEELAHFRAWFREFDWTAGDQEIEGGAGPGRLDAVAGQTLDERALRRPHGPRSGVNAIFGCLVTPESDEELIEALERWS